jgi:hypothetical protein
MAKVLVIDDEAQHQRGDVAQFQATNLHHIEPGGPESDRLTSSLAFFVTADKREKGPPNSLLQGILAGNFPFPLSSRKSTPNCTYLSGP